MESPDIAGPHLRSSECPGYWTRLRTEKQLLYAQDPHVPHVLAKLLYDKQDLQNVAYDSNAVFLLTSWLSSLRGKEEEDREAKYLKEGILTAIGIISQHNEDARRSVIELDGIPTIVESLRDEDDGVRAAACLCAKSLSRSRKAIKSSLFEAKIDAPLLSLLSDPSRQVQQTASATLCNLVLSFMPMKENILAAGGVLESGNIAVLREDGPVAFAEFFLR